MAVAWHSYCPGLVPWHNRRAEISSHWPYLGWRMCARSRSTSVVLRARGNANRKSESAYAFETSSCDSSVHRRRVGAGERRSSARGRGRGRGGPRARAFGCRGRSGACSRTKRYELDAVHGLLRPASDSRTFFTNAASTCEALVPSRARVVTASALVRRHGRGGGTPVVLDSGDTILPDRRAHDSTVVSDRRSTRLAALWSERACMPLPSAWCTLADRWYAPPAPGGDGAFARRPRIRLGWPADFRDARRSARWRAPS